MAILWKLIGGFKGAAIIVILIALGGYLFVQRNHLKEAEKARDEAITQRDSAATQRDKAIDAAKTNQETIDRMQEEKDSLNTALNTLASAKQTNRTNAATRYTTIQSTSTVPANAAVAASVIGTLITDIQADRIRRRTVTP